MSKYTTFKMSLQERTGTDFETGDPIYWVIVSSERRVFDDLHCSGDSVRSAFDEACMVIQSYVDRTCEQCADVTSEQDEAFRNSGVCQNCHDQMQRERGN
jgi:hypothetical protein